MKRSWFAAGVALVAMLFVARALQPGDPVAAAALWTYAQQTAGDDLTADVYVDVARELSHLRPWQAGYPAARARLRAIEAARRSLLTGDPRADIQGPRLPGEGVGP